MGLLDYLTRYSLRDLKARPTRTVLTILGITIGIAFMASLTSLTLSMKTRVSEDVESLLGSAILASDVDMQPMPVFHASTIAQIPGVTSVVPIVIGGGYTRKEAAILIGVPVSEMLSFVPSPDGRFPSSDSALEFITTDLGASSMRLRINDTLKITTQVYVGGINLKLVGTTEIGGFFQGLTAGRGSVIVTGLAAAQYLLNMRGYATHFVIRVAQADVADEVVRDVKATFPRLKVLTEKDLLANLNNILDTLDALMLSVSMVSLAVSGLSIMNSVGMSVAEKRREIGVLKSIGAENWHVLFIFLLQGVVMGVAGGILGGLGGYALAYYIVTELLPRIIGTALQFPFVYDMGTYARGFAIGLLMSALASLIPSWGATKVRPIEALRYE
jgi:putative ABC transport system permease protein